MSVRAAIAETNESAFCTAHEYAECAALSGANHCPKCATVVGSIKTAHHATNKHAKCTPFKSTIGSTFLYAKYMPQWSAKCAAQFFPEL